MDRKSLENYNVEDFISDESFINYHFKSNKNDQSFWEEWLINHPGKISMVKEAKEIINTLSLTVSEEEYKEELKKITDAINKSQLVFQSAAYNRSLPPYERKKRRVRYLIPLLLVISAGGLFFMFSNNHSKKLVETVNNANSPLRLTLNDSTIVTLAPHSSLQYPLHFDERERDVYLVGNAQFNVKRNVHHPFKVHAENIIATVLGTIFDIKSSGDSAIVVELLKGKLNVEIMDPKMQAHQSVLLAPNERAVYVRNEKHLYKNLIVPENSISFRQNNFNEIAGQIKNVFGVTVINNSNKKDWRFTGEFKNSSAKDIIENICLVKNLSFEMNGDTIVIK